MEKTISANKLKKNLNAVLREVNRSGDPVVVDSPTDEATAIVSLDDYRRLHELEQYRRHREAWDRFQQAQGEIHEQIADLGAEERESLADELSRETMKRIIANRQFRFVE